VALIRALVSVNFAGSLLIAIVCGIIIVQAPVAIQGQGQGAAVQELEALSQRLDQEKTRSVESISGIRAAAIRKVIDENVKTAQGVVAVFSSILGLVVSLRTLGGKKKKKG
jgi:hypothetical protein